MSKMSIKDNAGFGKCVNQLSLNLRFINYILLFFIYYKVFLGICKQQLQFDPEDF